MSNNKEAKATPQSVLLGESKNKTNNDFERIRQNLATRSLKVKFDLDGSQYKSIENIGAGAYGVVCSAINKKTGDKVAIKKTSHVFEVLTIAKRTYREIKILRHFKHDNIIQIRDLLLPKEDVKTFADIYIVFDLMESDLHHIIYSKQALSEEHIRYFLYQILRGLKYIHSANVVHRDLKPSNLLVNEDCHLRIGDFGMARGLSYTPDEPSYQMTQYVATRWYRAPEILLSMLEYGTAVDMWSVGCIFAEMMGRKHLFPGKDYISQVKLILGVLGTPSESWMKNCQNEILKRIIKSFGKKAAEPWHKFFPSGSKKSMDLLSRMLVLNPADRISVDQALAHRLLNQYHDPDDEPICVPAFNFDFEKKEMDMSELRVATMKEIMDFHQPKPPSLSFSAQLRPAPKVENDSIAGKDLKAFSQDVVLKKDIVLTAIDKEEPELRPVISDSTFGLKSELRSTRTSPVYVDTSKSQLDAPLSDIEMLSAKSNNGSMIIETLSKLTTEGEKPDVVIVPDKEKDVKPVVDKKGGNTISEDTKALVKQALLNATQRRQREPQGEDGEKAKPVTAAQRQKEREEKRKKKKERALEKGKKAKNKTVSQDKPICLSNEDLELLRRWTSMQFPSQVKRDGSTPSPPDPPQSPPQNSNNTSTITISNASGSNSTITITQFPVNSQSHPQSLIPSNKTIVVKNSKKFRQILSKDSAPSNVQQTTNVVNVTSNQALTGGPVVMPSSQFNLSMANFIPVIAIPSTTHPGNMEIKRIVTPAQTLPASTQLTTQSTTGPPAASDRTKSNLQQTIFRRSSGSGASTFPSSSTTSSSSQLQNVQEFKHLPHGRGQSLVLHHRHSTGSMDVARHIVKSIEENENKNQSQNSEFQPAGIQFNSVSDESDLFKSSGQEMTSVKREDSSNRKQSTQDILDLLETSPNAFDSLLESPQSHVPNHQDNSSFGHRKMNPDQTNTTTRPPPPYPFHRSPQQVQNSSPSPSGSFPSSSSSAASSNSQVSSQNQPFSHNDFNVFQSNSSNTQSNTIPNSFPQEQNSGTAFVHDFINGASFNTNSEFNVQDSSFLHDSDIGVSNLPVSTSNSCFDHSMDHQQSHSLPFQNYSDHKQHQYQHNIQQHQQGQQQQQFDTPQQSQLRNEPNYQHQHQEQQQQRHLFDSTGSFNAQQNPQNFNLAHSSIMPASSSSSSSSTSFNFMNQDYGFSQGDQSHSFDYVTQQQQKSQQQDQYNQQQNQFLQQQQQQQHNQFQQQQHNQFQQGQQQQHNQFQQQQQQHHLQGYNSQSGMFTSHLTGQQHAHHQNEQHASNYDSNAQLNPGASYFASSVGNTSPEYSGASAYSSSPGSKSKSPQLTVNTQKESRDSNPDLIALLTKQLSKSQVVDIFPPALALTPRGTGAGYGVGMDLDAMLTDAQDNASMRVEQSPLSSSLLADWLDVSGSISQADIEALERELALPSPMNVSYNDVNM